MERRVGEEMCERTDEVYTDGGARTGKTREK